MTPIARNGLTAGVRPLRAGEPGVGPGSVVSLRQIAGHTDNLLRDDGPASVGPMVLELRLRNTPWRSRPNTEVLQRANTSMGATSCDTIPKPPG